MEVTGRGLVRAVGTREAAATSQRGRLEGTREQGAGA